MVENCLRVFEGHNAAVSSVVFSPDDKYCLSGSYDLRLWDVESGECIRIFEGHTDYITSVTFSPDGRFALSGCGDKTLRLWDVAIGKCIRVFEGHSGYIFTVTYFPDGTLCLSGGEDQTLRLWDIATGECLRIFEGHTHTVHSIAFSPDGKYCLSASKDKTLRLWDVATGKCIRVFEGEYEYNHSIAFSPDGKYCLSSGDNKNTRLLNVETGDCVRIFVRSIAVAFLPDGKYCLLGGALDDDNIRLFNVETGENLQEFVGHTSAVSSVAVSHDGNYFLSGSRDGTVRLWKIGKKFSEEKLSIETAIETEILYSHPEEVAYQDGSQRFFYFFKYIDYKTDPTEIFLIRVISRSDVSPYDICVGIEGSDILVEQRFYGKPHCYRPIIWVYLDDEKKWWQAISGLGHPEPLYVDKQGRRIFAELNAQHVMAIPDKQREYRNVMSGPGYGPQPTPCTIWNRLDGTPYQGTLHGAKNVILKGPWEVENKKDGCFIATAVGAGNNDLYKLRLYRDTVLKSSSYGNLLIYVYYKISPFLANIIKDKPVLRKITKWGLVDPLIKYTEKVLGGIR